MFWALKASWSSSWWGKWDGWIHWGWWVSLPTLLQLEDARAFIHSYAAKNGRDCDVKGGVVQRKSRGEKEKGKE
jgi:hypothetical protein